MKLRILALLALPFAIACTESEKPAATTATAEKAAVAAPAAARPGPDGRIEIHATKQGYEPSKIEVEAGKPVTLVFVREIEKTCMTGVVFPDLGIEKDLPVGEKVEIELTPEAGGTIAFQCPMGMGKSSIVTLPQS
jgi:Cu+-exporting ATPase